MLSGLSRGRVRETTDATRWLVVRARLLWRSRDGIGKTARRDLLRFMALQRDNIPTPACLDIYGVNISGSTELLLELYYGTQLWTFGLRYACMWYEC